MADDERLTLTPREFILSRLSPYDLWQLREWLDEPDEVDEHPYEENDCFG